MYGQFGIAFSSDNWKRSKLGRRRPFFILLAPLMAMAYFLLLFPIGADTPALASAYFAVFFTLQSLLFDGLSTLYASFLNEQTSDPSDRASLFGAMSVASVAGVVSGALISLALPVEDRLLVLGGCFGAFQLISFYLLAWKGHEPRFKGITADHGDVVPLVPGLRMCMLNAPWRRYIWMFSVMSLINELPGIYPFYLQYVLDVKPDEVYTWLGIWVVSYCVCAMCAIPCFVYVLKRWGKMTVLYGGCCLLTLHGITFFFVPSASIGLAAVVLLGTSIGTFNMLSGILLSEIIDYDELASGKRREALYNCITSIPQRFMTVSGKAFPLLGLASLGYQPNVEQNQAVKWFLRGLISFTPIFMGVASALIMRGFPLSDEKHREVVQAIAQRRNGEIVIDPVLGIEMSVLDADSQPQLKHEWTLHYFGYDQLNRTLRWGQKFLFQEVSANFLLFLGASIGCLLEAGFVLYYNSEKQVAVDIAFVFLFLGCFFSACAVFLALQLTACCALQRMGGSLEAIERHLKMIRRNSLPDEIAVTSRWGLMARILLPRVLVLAAILAIGALAVAESDLLPLDPTNSTTP